MNNAGLPRPYGDSQYCIILGMGPQALFLLREYRRYYRKVFLVGERNWVGYLSRHGSKIVAKDGDLQTVLNRVVAKTGEETPILISGGKTLRYYLENAWLHRFNCYPRPLPALRILNDKGCLLEYARKIGYPFDRLETVRFEERPGASFPIILKWRTDTEEKPFKVVVLRTEKEYENAWRKYQKYAGCLVAQRLVEKKRSIAWAAYCEGGHPAIDVLVRQVRQYPPGLTNLVEPYQGGWAPEIREWCRRLVLGLSYTGFIEVEFLQDAASGRMYLLEANPRPWGWIDYLTFHKKDAEIGRPMVNMVRDFYYICSVERRKFRRNAFRSIIRYLNYRKLNWRWNDPLPIVGQLMRNRE